MEEQDIKQLWQAYDAQLQQALRVNEATLQELQTLKAKRAVRGMLWVKWLGIIVGVLFVIPLGTLQVVQPFWLLTLTALFLGRWPNGVPPAWQTGKAEPWPTQQELREERDKAKAAQLKAAGKAEPEAEPEPAAAAASTGPAHPSSKKRKRKRRR